MSSLSATVSFSVLVRACVWQFTVTKATPASGFWAFYLTPKKNKGTRSGGKRANIGKAKIFKVWKGLQEKE